MRNDDERYILELCRTIPEMNPRYATAEEDYGHKKADVVLEYQGRTIYLQISHSPKSRQQQRALLERGTHPLATHTYREQRTPDDELRSRILDIVTAQQGGA
ncbi:TPA: hypothetical protein HA251_01380 [Candidatus Woesearchaeota archaeon]|nr:hypothetical protein [Candidatus Woesearchaeota archaeon]